MQAVSQSALTDGSDRRTDLLRLTSQMATLGLSAEYIAQALGSLWDTSNNQGVRPTIPPMGP